MLFFPGNFLHFLNIINYFETFFLVIFYHRVFAWAQNPGSDCCKSCLLACTKWVIMKWIPITKTTSDRFTVFHWVSVNSVTRALMAAWGYLKCEDGRWFWICRLKSNDWRMWTNMLIVKLSSRNTWNLKSMSEIYVGSESQRHASCWICDFDLS